MNRRYIREQKTICGAEYMEIDLFPVTEQEHRASRRAKKEKASSIAMQNCNERYSRRYLVQLVATNFSKAEGALVLHLTYDDAYLPGTWEQAGRDATNYLRKIARRSKKKGLPPPKWILATEHQEADPMQGVKEVRFHHHLILQCGLSLDEIKDCWCTGRGMWREPLGLITADRAEFEHGTLEGFCKYITKYPRRRRRWRQSQGLKKPERPTPNDTRYSARKLDQIARECIDDRAFWENRYGRQTRRNGARKYAFVEAEARYNEIAGTWHVVAKFWADPRRQEKQKKARRRRKDGDPA